MSNQREACPISQGTNISALESAELDRLLTEAGRHPVQCVCKACVRRAFNPDYMHASEEEGLELDEDTIAVRCAIAGMLAVCVLIGICMGIAALNGWI